MGYKACTHCLDDTDNIWLTHCKKVVYMGHRRFLPIRHAVRKKGKHFKGQADHRTKPMHRSGKDVFNMVKDLEVNFGNNSACDLILWIFGMLQYGSSQNIDFFLHMGAIPFSFGTGWLPDPFPKITSRSFTMLKTSLPLRCIGFVRWSSWSLKCLPFFRTECLMGRNRR